MGWKLLFGHPEIDADYTDDPINVNLKIKDNIWNVNFKTKGHNQNLIVKKEGDNFKNCQELFS